MPCDFTPFSTVFQSNQDDRKLMLKGWLQGKPVYDWKEFLLRESNWGPLDQQPALTPLSYQSSCTSYTSTFVQSGPQDQKSVIFLHSVISLNQLLQNSKNTAHIVLTIGNRVKLFLSQNILHNVLNAEYRKVLGQIGLIKQWRPCSDCSLRSSLIRASLFVILSASFTHHTARKPQIVQF